MNLITLPVKTRESEQKSFNQLEYKLKKIPLSSEKNKKRLLLLMINKEDRLKNIRTNKRIFIMKY